MEEAWLQEPFLGRGEIKSQRMKETGWPKKPELYYTLTETGIIIPTSHTGKQGREVK